MIPKLTIIVPVYQAGDYLKRCLDSILRQTIQDFELIVIDDGSTDDSGKICDDYAIRDNRVKVVHKSNQGQAAARNDGINIAKGEYVGFVDNDDMIYPDMFEVLIRNIEDTKADISACSFIQDNGDGTITTKNHSSQKVMLSNNEGIREFLSRTNIDIYVWTKIYKRSFLDQYLIRFETGKIDEDFLFNFEAFKHAQMIIMEDIPKYVYSHRENSACRLFPQRHFKEYLCMTLYRVDKILDGTEELYPEYTYLAKRQKIKYCFIMLKIIIQTGKLNVENEYRHILGFLKKSIRQVYKDRKITGNSVPGIILLKVLPYNVYYHYRRMKENFFR